MSQPDRESPGFGIVTGLVRRRYRVMLPFLLLLPIAVLVFSLAQENRYSASASVLFQDLGAISSDSSVLASESPEREAATSVGLLSLDETRRRVATRLGGERSLAEDVEVAAQGESNLLSIEATDASPTRAARTANAFAREYVAIRRTIERRGAAEQEESIRRELESLSLEDREGPVGEQLSEELTRLELRQSGSSVGAQIVSSAEPPSSPSSPKPVRNTLLGGILGVFLAVGAALLFDRLDPRVKDPDEIESTLERPILGLVRQSRDLARMPIGRGPPGTHSDDFIALRAYLHHVQQDRNIQSVLITSGAARDGKTTISWNLAVAAASPSSRVLLVEADLHQPRIGAALGMEPERGLGQVLDGTAILSDVIHDVAIESTGNGRAPANVLSVVFAGQRPGKHPDPTDWERLAEAVSEIKRDFDLLLIDTPPMVMVPETIPLVSTVDGVIVVSRLGNTPRSALARLRDQLTNMEAPVVGAIVNSVARDDAYAYGYGYGYYARDLS